MKLTTNKFKKMVKPLPETTAEAIFVDNEGFSALINGDKEYFLDKYWLGHDLAKYDAIAIHEKAGVYKIRYHEKQELIFLPTFDYALTLVTGALDKLILGSTGTEVDFDSEVSKVVGEKETEILKDIKKYDFYDVVGGTNSTSKYVLVGKAKGVFKSSIAVRYKGGTFSIRIDPVPEAQEFVTAMELLGVKPTSGSHWSNHLSVADGAPMVRFLIIFKGVFSKLYDLSDMNMGTIGKLGV